MPRSAGFTFVGVFTFLPKLVNGSLAGSFTGGLQNKSLKMSLCGLPVFKQRLSQNHQKPDDSLLGLQQKIARVSLLESLNIGQVVVRFQNIHTATFYKHVHQRFSRLLYEQLYRKRWD